MIGKLALSDADDSVLSESAAITARYILAAIRRVSNGPTIRRDSTSFGADPERHKSRTIGACARTPS